MSWDGQALFQMWKSFQKEFMYDGKWCFEYDFRSKTGLKSAYFRNRKAFLERKSSVIPRRDSIRIFLSWFLNRGHDPSSDLDTILDHDAQSYWIRRSNMIKHFREDMEFIDSTGVFDNPESLAVTEDGSTSLIMEYLNHKMIRYETLIILDHMSNGRLLQKMQSVKHYDKMIGVYETRMRHYSQYWLKPTAEQRSQIETELESKMKIEEVWYE